MERLWEEFKLKASADARGRHGLAGSVHPDSGTAGLWERPAAKQ